jgi:hypothetical protein
MHSWARTISARGETKNLATLAMMGHGMRKVSATVSDMWHDPAYLFIEQAGHLAVAVPWMYNRMPVALIPPVLSCYS